MSKGSSKGKDPAVLWYWNDWGGGTRTLTRVQKGAYMDLLEAQFNNGSLSESEIRTVLGSDFGTMWPTLQKKFKKADDGTYYNERLYVEINKRQKFTKSRADNLKGSKNEESDHHMGSHMGNENENEKEIKKGCTGENLTEHFLNELENSSQLETVAMRLRVPKEKLIAAIPQFKLAADLSYPNFNKFVDHFKNWYRKQSTTAEAGSKTTVSFSRKK